MSNIKHTPSQKKLKTLIDIQKDQRIERVELNYDGKGRHMVECKDGYRFEGERTIDIGNISELCGAINDWLEPYKHYQLLKKTII